MPIRAAMEIPPALLQFVGSLAAIVALAALAWWLKLGPARRLENDADARREASEAVDGFEPVEIAIDREGRAGLLRDAGGQILLLRQHGTHFAGRVLTPAASARIDTGALVVDTAEKRYGGVRLELDDPSVWLQHIESLKTH
ncbi:hypothetical protein [Erythrobacter sp. QSSC1-22B]|uniref:hypothetical protein n=1 Tax=Erythrobacter sp. QSSC1-22B TaxID=1860125 RepID=UPI001F40CAB5|nr:hypothetical protein [Erythrobacter sp. QSSC1-22B]